MRRLIIVVVGGAPFKTSSTLNYNTINVLHTLTLETQKETCSYLFIFQNLDMHLSENCRFLTYPVNT